MRRLSLGVALICLMAFTGPALGGEPKQPPEKETPSELLKEATRGILKALGLILQSIPQYEAPEILDNGDIIIRRKNPKPMLPPEKGPNPDTPDKTKT